LGSVLPYYEPDLDICTQALSIAEDVFKFVNDTLQSGQSKREEIGTSE